MNRRRVSLLLAVLWGCSHRPEVLPAPEAPLPPVSISPQAAEAARAKLAAQAPASFKMLHQVVAKYQGRDYLMAGYLLGRKDGSFRVSATAAVGPKLFDVAKVDGRWESRVYLKEAADRFDPANLGRAVERIYFLPASGPLKADAGRWTSRSTVSGEEDIDTVVEWREDVTLALRRKRYFRDGKQVLQVDYDQLERVQGTWLARTVRLTDSRGFTLDLSVTDYEPGYAVPDSALKIPGS
jgi:hypothetical protein